MTEFFSAAAKRTVVITGGNQGVGFACAAALADSRQNCCIIIAGHNRERIAAAAAKLRQQSSARVEPMLLNLASLRSIHYFSENLAGEVRLGNLPPLHAVVCNAAVLNPFGIIHTADGYEQTFGVNHLGHFMLVNALLPQMLEPGRIVVVAGGSGRLGRRVDQVILPSLPKARHLACPDQPGGLRLSGLARYRYSKYCNLLFAHELHRRLEVARQTGGPGIGVNVFHPSPTPGTQLARQWPGWLQWLWRSKFLRTFGRTFGANIMTVEESGCSLAGLVLDPTLQGVSGRCFHGGRERHSMEIPGDPAVSRKLWEDCAELLRWQPAGEAPRTASPASLLTLQKL